MEPQSSTANQSNKRLKEAQSQVNEVVGIMRVNVEKVLERDQKLSELDNRADALQQGASQFEQQANRLKRKYWWKNLKMMIIMGIIGVILLIVIIGTAYVVVLLSLILSDVFLFSVWISSEFSSSDDDTAPKAITEKPAN